MSKEASVLFYNLLISHQLSIMNQGSNTMIIFFILLILIFSTQLTNGQDDQQEDPTSTNFQPSLYVVVVVLSFMFSSIFLLLLYAKYCHRPPTAIHSVNGHRDEGMFGPNTRFSGLDKTVVESLPFFRFSALKGSKQGLQCSVCLTEFEDVEILRLLPKCKHGFHIKCIDQWLENHSTCPLCRQKICAQDLAMVISSSLNVTEDFGSSSMLELFVEREEDNNQHGSSKWSIGGSFRRIFKANKEEEILGMQQQSKQGRVLHGFNHQMVMSDVMFKNRWSNITSSDLLFLNSEMLGFMSSNRFSEHPDKLEMGSKRVFEQINGSNSGWSSKLNMGFDDSRQINLGSLGMSSLIPGDRRSMSEITALSRFNDLTSMKNKLRVTNNDDDDDDDDVREDIKKRKIWFSTAKKTIQWFANREKSRIRSQQEQQQSQKTEQILFV